jgi:type I restriction enzyme M protein
LGKATKPANGSQGGQSELTINELEGWLWDAACSIRGAVDAPKFKDYILPLIFVKRLSDVFDDEVERLTAKFGDRKTALELIEDDHSLVRFYIPPKASWSEIRKLTANVGQRLTEIIRLITKANPSLQGVIDIVDFNATVSGQRIIEDNRLQRLTEILSRQRLGLKDVEPDILGRAYEYLLRKFAEGQGSSAGEFFTPQEVGWLVARLLRPAEGMTIYDPACGSGGLLVKAELVLKETTPKVNRPMRLYGQELNHVTYAIAKMNTIIHDMDAEIAIGDTLRNPKFLVGPKLKTFDLVAANPMWNQDGYGADFYESDSYGRFGFGHPPGSSADLGWVQHMLSSINQTGRAVIVLDTGAASRGSGGQASNREREIRKRLVDADLVEAVLLLPENLFYNTNSPGILVCLNKSKAPDRRGKIVLVNAASEFEKGRPKNFIPKAAADKILAGFLSNEDLPNFVKWITNEEVAASDYNLSPSRYVSGALSAATVTVADAVVELQEAESDRARADADLQRALRALGVSRRH